MRILLVEDDELLGNCLRTGLTQYQYVVDWVKNGSAAWSSLQSENFDMILLDLGLPKISGEEVLKSIRLKNITTPVIVITARDSIGDLIKGLDIGADDYIAKPFSLEELCARIRAVKRRGITYVDSKLVVGNIELDNTTRTVSSYGKIVELSRREFILLQMLMEKAGKVLHRKQISQSLYGWGDDIDSNTLEVHIHNLRKKIGKGIIKTIRGVGYMLQKKV